jgi:hypothetical protein
MARTRTALTALALGTLVACGGGGGSGPAAPVAATALVYTDPSADTYRLVRNSQSTPTHLVLDLVGPSGAQLRGVGMVLALGGLTIASWAPVTPGGVNYVQEGAGLTLGAAPRAVVGKLATGTELQLGLFQKGPAVPVAVPGAVPLASVALELNPGAAPGTVTLSPVAGKAFIQDAGGAVVAITPVLGTVTAK